MRAKNGFVSEVVYSMSAGTTTVTGAIQSYIDKYNWVESPKFAIVATENSGSANLTVTIESKLDGTNYVPLVNFTALTGSGNAVPASGIVNGKQGLGTCVKALFSTSGGSWDLKVYMYGLVQGPVGR